MLFIKSIKIKIAVTVFLLFSTAIVVAQTPAKVAAQSTESGYNQLATLLMILIVVLAFVIWGMGQVLTALGKQLVEKHKKPSSLPGIIALAALLFISPTAFAEGTPAATVTLPNYGGLTASAYYMFLTVIGMELVVIFFLAFSIRRMYAELLPQKAKPVFKENRLAAWWSKLDKKLFTKAVAVDKEADILLDHNYDGIKELDNSLPPWWKYGFYVTIIISFIYLLNFHVLGIGLSPTEEYDAEMQKAKIEKEIFDANNKDKIDENNILMPGADGLAAGQRLFEANCTACHLKDGGGSVGPNLTDNYWLHKGSLNDIYNTIKVGYPDKGMQSWSSNFSPKEISFLAGYIKSLGGTKPAVAKEQQGEFYVDAVAGAAKDSATVVSADTAVIKK